MTTPPALYTLNEETLQQGLQTLCDRDADLAEVRARFGSPPLWAREPGFPTLIHIILEQQVSLASARAAFDRLLAIASPLTPARFLALDEQTLKAAGFSRQKTAYGRGLARAIDEGHLDLDELVTFDDEIVHSKLVAIKGIGSWTATIYLLMALRRPDVWPSADLALAVAAQRVKKLEKRPTPQELDALGDRWRPWRAVAARLLWRHYLSNR